MSSTPGSGSTPVEKLIEVGEFKVNVATAGKGPVLLMLHGEERRPSWQDWKEFFSLADNYKLVMPDLVGFGKSSHPRETPDYNLQARVLHELLETMNVGKVSVVGYSWGGQVALELAINSPENVESLVLVASTYDKSQIPKLGKVRRPTLLIWAEDDLITQLKAGYLLRDAIRTSRLEVLTPVAKDPKHDLRIAHRLLESRPKGLEVLFRRFLASPSGSTAEPPEMENELKGMAMKGEGEKK